MRSPGFRHPRDPESHGYTGFAEHITDAGVHTDTGELGNANTDRTARAYANADAGAESGKPVGMDL